MYNSAGIDDQKIVWAHDMGEEKNRELLEYFSDREICLVTVGFAPMAEDVPQLQSYEMSGAG